LRNRLSGSPKDGLSWRFDLTDLTVLPGGAR
jgi:hypothetical protein